MKKITSLWLAAAMLLAPLAGCGTEPDLGVIGGADGPTAIITADSGTRDRTSPAQESPPDGEQPAQADGEASAQGNTPEADGEALGPAVTGSEVIQLGDTVLEEEGWYTGREEVALYLMQYGRLPGNYITKAEARELGWEGGSLEPYAPGKSIGGDRFGNYEGTLPDADGRSYTECDIDTGGAGGRGAKRIVFSSDGLIFYTEDHYETFTILSGVT